MTRIQIIRDKCLSLKLKAEKDKKINELLQAINNISNKENYAEAVYKKNIWKKELEKLMREAVVIELFLFKDLKISNKIIEMCERHITACIVKPSHINFPNQYDFEVDPWNFARLIYENKEMHESVLEILEKYIAEPETYKIIIEEIISLKQILKNATKDNRFFLYERILETVLKIICEYIRKIQDISCFDYAIICRFIFEICKKFSLFDWLEEDDDYKIYLQVRNDINNQ
jgi:hypothetical protein